MDISTMIIAALAGFLISGSYYTKKLIADYEVEIENLNSDIQELMEAVERYKLVEGRLSEMDSKITRIEANNKR
jgi:hypothetical protein